VLEQNIMVVEVCGKELFTSWQTGRRERKGRGTRNNLQRHVS
jgi:hypothetical protein